MKRFLLVCPSAKGINALPLPPLGMLWVAAFIMENSDVLVDAIDMSIEQDDVILKKKINASDIVGISITSSHMFNDAVRISHIASDIYGKPTIAGGVHATVLPEECAPHFDIVVRGEGEQTALDIVTTLPNDVSHIPGITYIDEHQVIHSTPDREHIKDIDTIPLPARDILPPDKYPYRELKRFHSRYTSILGGRGCPNKCIFCASPVIWKGSRLRKSEYIYKEMVQIYNNWGINNIHFHDDTFTLDRQRVIKLCNMIIKGNINFKWSCITRPDKIDHEIISMMKKAGCVQVEIGAESADKEILKTARKAYSPSQVQTAFQIARHHSISTYAYFIIGLPGETIFTWLKTILFARKLKADNSVFTVASPFPGTELHSSNSIQILKQDCWLYKKPVIKTGYLGPVMLSIMRKISDIVVNGIRYHGAYTSRQKF